VTETQEFIDQKEKSYGLRLSQQPGRRTLNPKFMYFKKRRCPSS
jgi:hypothetical protein